MQKQKRWVALALVACLCISLSACGAPKAEPGKKASPAYEIDYSKTQNWAFFGGEKERNADLFIVCPTVLQGDDTLVNMSMDDAKTKESFVGALRMELGIYEQECRVYAPFYRQASLSAYAKGGNTLERAVDLASVDVLAAFDAYLEKADPKRPIVLAGFSQGSQILITLLKERFQSENMQKRLIAAYAIGWRLTEQECARYPQIKPAQGESDTGVIVSFNSEAEAITSSMMVPAGLKTHAINPLNWKTDSTPAAASENLGACFTGYSGEIKSEKKALCGAYIDPVRGALKVTGISADDYPSALDIFEKGIYHIYDYQFFYRNLQKNVTTRVAAYQTAKAAA